MNWQILEADLKRQISLLSFGDVTVTFTIHDKEVRKIQTTTTEKTNIKLWEEDNVHAKS